MPAFVEVADRVWVARQEWFDLNVVLVGGSGGLVVVDTQGSGRAAADIVQDIVRALGIGEVTAIVNTHDHFDHTFGNGAFRSAYGQVPIHAHEVAAELTPDSGERVKARYAESDDPRRDEVLETEVVVADHTFSSTRVLDLGDRALELSHLGRGHTAGDVVIAVRDADVLLAGDLVEESGPPAYGTDCHPLDWPDTIARVLHRLGPDTVVVPGHGALVQRGFVDQQHRDISATAQTIRDLASAGQPPEQALAAAEWPFPRDQLAHAITRGYLQLQAGGALPLR